MPKVFAEAISNIDLTTAAHFYFFFDLDLPVPYNDLYRLYGYWCDILKTEGGYHLRSHHSRDFKELQRELRYTDEEFPHHDYKINVPSNLWLRDTAKWIEWKGVRRIISDKPEVLYCPVRNDCPYGNGHPFIRKLYRASHW